MRILLSNMLNKTAKIILGNADDALAQRIDAQLELNAEYTSAKKAETLTESLEADLIVRLNALLDKETSIDTAMEAALLADQDPTEVESCEPEVTEDEVETKSPEAFYKEDLIPALTALSTPDYARLQGVIGLALNHKKTKAGSTASYAKLMHTFNTQCKQAQSQDYKAALAMLVLLLKTPDMPLEAQKQMLLSICGR